MRGAVEKLGGDSALNGSEALKHSHRVTGILVAALPHKEEQAMGLLSAFVKGKLLQKALGGSGGAAHSGRSRGGLFGMLIAGAAAMLLKRAFRRR